MINMNEEIFYEGGPAKSDLIINLLAGITILGLPFTFAAIVRALWLRYKISNKRIAIDGGCSRELCDGWFASMVGL